MQSSREVLKRDLPVVALKDEYPSGFTDPMHSHDVVQMLFAIRGVMAIKTSDRAFVIPPQRGLLIPAGMEHEVDCRGPVSLRTIYIKSGPLIALREARVLEVSDLVKALILEVTGFGETGDKEGRQTRIIELLLSEIQRLPRAPYSVAMPANPRLLRVCAELLENPSDDRDIDAWSDVAAMGRRTFTRAFRRETGVGFATWRQQVRLMAAISLLSEGFPITRTALEVGYDSPSGFATMFRKAFGVPPSQYLRQPGVGPDS